MCADEFLTVKNRSKEQLFVLFPAMTQHSAPDTRWLQVWTLSSLKIISISDHFQIRAQSHDMMWISSFILSTELLFGLIATFTFGTNGKNKVSARLYCDIYFWVFTINCKSRVSQCSAEKRTNVLRDGRFFPSCLGTFLTNETSSERKPGQQIVDCEESCEELLSPWFLSAGGKNVQLDSECGRRLSATWLSETHKRLSLTANSAIVSVNMPCWNWIRTYTKMPTIHQFKGHWPKIWCGSRWELYIIVC